MSKKTTSRVQGTWAGQSSQSHRRVPKKVNANENSELVNTQYTFQQLNKEDLKQPPKLQIIRNNGEHTLSTTCNGTSKIVVDSGFIEKPDADWMFDTLLNEVQWKQEYNFKYKTNEGRLSEWFSDYPYSYSGVLQKPNKNWHPLLTALRDRLNEKFQLGFNSVLANYYRNGHDSVDWHSDSEPALGQNPSIASISFGDARNFELREILKDADKDFTFSRQHRITLTHGSLLLMTGATQRDWQHRVPREYHDRKARINLTFRRMHPECAS